MMNSAKKHITSAIVFPAIMLLLFMGCTDRTDFNKTPAPVTSSAGVGKMEEDKKPERKIPPPPPVSTPFPNRRTVKLSELEKEMERLVPAIAQKRHRRREFAALAKDNKMKDDEKTYIDFVKAVLIFECTRDSGLWHIHWKITNQQPNSDRIWAQWKKQNKKDYSKEITAIAECDEISALYAFLLRKMGIRGVGLFWPTSNHTVAVWKLKDKNGREARIVAPTTQIYLKNQGMFGTKKFDPWKQPAIYDYRRNDVGDNYRIPVPLARFFVNQAEKYGSATAETLLALRNMREAVNLGYLTRKDAEGHLARYRESCLGAGVPDEDIWAMDYFHKEFLKEDE